MPAKHQLSLSLLRHGYDALPRFWQRHGGRDSARARERFAGPPPGDFELVAQGGGSVTAGHRCPGEPVTMMLLDRTLQLLSGASWTASTAAPARRRIPTLPGGGMTIHQLALEETR